MEVTCPSGASLPGWRARAARVAEPLAILAIMLVAVALRLNRLGDHSLWVDEAMSVLFSARPLPELLQLLVTEDIHPPLYPVLLHYWMAIAGTSEFAARLPSVFFGVALIPLMYVVGKRLELLSQRKEAVPLSLVGLVAATLAATSSFYIGYSQEARSYMALTFIGLASSYLLLRALSSSGWRGWAAYGLATGAAMYTHYMAFLLLVAQLLFVMLAGRAHPGARRRWFLCAAIAGIAYLPWLGYSLGQIQRISDYWPGTLQLEDALRTSLLQFVAGGGIGLNTMVIPAMLGLGLLTLGIVALVFGGARSRAGEPALFLLLYLIVPSALLFAIAYYRPKFDPRYLLVVTPAFYLILAWGIAALLRSARSRGLPLLLRAGLPLAGAATLGGLLLVSAVYGEPTRVAHVGDGKAPIPEYGDYRSLVQFLESKSQPGDAVVLLMNTYHPYVYYSKLQIPHYEMEPFDDFDGAVIRLNRMMANQHRRLWFILWQKEWADPADYVMHLMETQATEVPLEASFGGLGLRLFQLPADERFSYYPRVDNKTEAIFGKSLEFWGWNVSSPEVPRGGTIQFDFHWRPIKKVEADLKIVLSLLDGDGHLWLRIDETMVAPTYPSSRWKVQDIIHDRHRLVFPPSLPPGSYNVQAQLYDSRTLAEVPIELWSGAGLGTTLSLGQVTVKPSPVQASSTASPPRATWNLGKDRLELLGSSLGRKVARPGEGVEVTLTWRAATPPSEDYAVSVALLDPRGEVHGRQLVTISTQHPTSRWQQGEVVDSKLWFPLPVTLSPDGYRIAVAPVSPGQKEVEPLHMAQLDVVEILALSGIFELPPMQNRVGALLGGRAELAGYDLDRSSVRPGDKLTLTLYWRARDTLERSYKVYNHVINGANQFAGQRDGVPLGDTRPTTTWRKGEVLIDRYEIPISADARPGSYSLKVGMYPPEGGERLSVTAPDGSPAGDAVMLKTIEVLP